MHDEVVELIGKWITAVDPETRERLADSLHEKGLDAEALRAYQRTWELTGDLQMRMEPDVDQEWARFQADMAAEEAPADPGPETSQALARRWWLRIAALLVVAVGTFFLVRNLLPGDRPTQVVERATQGTRDLVLADGSQVSLRRGSRLEYVSDFGEAHRAMALTGEAFFEVQSGQPHPFVVQAGNVRIQVIGTTFRVAQTEETVTVNLVEGSLSIQAGEQEARTMVAGQQATVERQTGSMQFSSFETGNMLSWKTKKLVFEAQPFSLVKQDLETYFGIQVQGELPDNCVVSADFEEPTMAEVAQVFLALLGIQLEQINATTWKFSETKCKG